MLYVPFCLSMFVLCPIYLQVLTAHGRLHTRTYWSDLKKIAYVSWSHFDLWVSKKSLAFPYYIQSSITFYSLLWHINMDQMERYIVSSVVTLVFWMSHPNIILIWVFCNRICAGHFLGFSQNTIGFAESALRRLTESPTVLAPDQTTAPARRGEAFVIVPLLLWVEGFFTVRLTRVPTFVHQLIHLTRMSSYAVLGF